MNRQNMSFHWGERGLIVTKTGSNCEIQRHGNSSGNAAISCFFFLTTQHFLSKGEAKNGTTGSSPLLTGLSKSLNTGAHRGLPWRPSSAAARANKKPCTVYNTLQRQERNLISSLWRWQIEGSSNHSPRLLFFLRGLPLLECFQRALFQMYIQKKFQWINETTHRVYQARISC